MNKKLKFVLIFLSGIICYFIFATIYAMTSNKEFNTQPLIWALCFGLAIGVGSAIVNYFMKKK